MAEPALRQTTPNTTTTSAPPRSSKMDMVLVALVALNVAGLGGLGFAVSRLWQNFQTLKLSQEKKESPEPAETNPLGKELQPAKLGVLYGLEAFLVNIPSEQGTKFLQLQMEFELSEPALEDELNRKKAAIRDTVIVQLSSKSFQQLRGARAMRDLQQDLLKSVNQLLVTGKVKEIYFTQFHFN